MNEMPTQPAGPARSDRAYLAIVGVLLVVIVAALAVLWIGERRARIRCERRLADVSGRQAIPPRLLELLNAQGDQEPSDVAAPAAPEEAFVPIRREDLPAETVQFEGRQRTVFRISAHAGRRIGFRPGDVIVVGEQAETDTLSAPARQ